MVYALLGLTTNADELQISADYRQHWINIYQEVAIKLITKHRLGFLTYTGSTPPSGYIAAHLSHVSGPYLPS